ncbi:MAG TPA: heme o synthase [Bacteroidota bacterium]|jgi:protoheme IX farnesyltransferase
MNHNVSPEGAVSISRSRVTDYITLMKPELTLLSVCTALVSCFMAAWGTFPLVPLLDVFVGTLLIGAGAGALNQYIERDFDAMMRRTENRPLPAGRLSRNEALVFGSTLSMAGVVFLFLTTNLLAAFLGATTLVSYVFLYTPLKRITPFSTVIGGIPGALPPVIGWTAVRGEITVEALVLFGILFLWQMPHFYSLAWMYRKDYERAGYPMLTVLDESGQKTSIQILIHSALLIPVSILLTLTSTTGTVYGVSALIIGILFFIAACRLFKLRTNGAARTVFFASLIYLPLLMFLMAIDKL